MLTAKFFPLKFGKMRVWLKKYVKKYSSQESGPINGIAKGMFNYRCEMSAIFPQWSPFVLGSKEKVPCAPVEHAIAPICLGGG